MNAERNESIAAQIKAAIERLGAWNIEIERLVVAHDIHSDSNRVRVEMTFDLR